MNVEEYLKQLMIEKSGSVRAFSQSIGLAPTTIQTILDRGVMNAGVSNVFKICAGLGIKPEILASDMFIEANYTSVRNNTDVFEQIEKTHGKSTSDAFSMYTQLDPDHQGEIRGEMKHMLKSEKYSIKKESLNA